MKALFIPHEHLRNAGRSKPQPAPRKPSSESRPWEYAERRPRMTATRAAGNHHHHGSRGHGVVEKTGDRVTKFRSRPRHLDSTVYCNECEFCLSARSTSARTGRVLACPVRIPRTEPWGIVVVPNTSCTSSGIGELPPGALIEPLSISLHAVNRAKLTINDKVAVMGCGIIAPHGHPMRQARGCGTLIAIDSQRREADMRRRSARTSS
jgi:threonine dehydrogenase-like Zn-dependent dehydrogenase